MGSLSMFLSLVFFLGTSMMRMKVKVKVKKEKGRSKRGRKGRVRRDVEMLCGGVSRGSGVRWLSRAGWRVYRMER